MGEKTWDEVVKESEFHEGVKRNYYAEFQQEEKIPVHTDFCIDDLKTIAVQPWERMGGLGAYVNFYGEEILGDNYVCEIPPGESLKPQKHLFEELVYVVSGRGATTLWSKEGGPKRTFEWKEQSFFALPANVNYRHFNGDEKKPARLFAKTTLPVLFQYFRDRDFIFNNDFVFEDLDKDFYSAEAKIYKMPPPDYKIVWVSNFVPDVMAFDKMTSFERRGAGGTGAEFYQPGLVRLRAHMSEFPVGTYKKAHAHPSGRSIIIITGEGFSLLWQPGKENEKKKIYWRRGSVFGVGLTNLQGEVWYHQHFNTSREPARYLVLHVNGSLYHEKHVPVEYVDEDPEIRGLFEGELAKSGLTSRMPPQCYTDRKFKWKG